MTEARAREKKLNTAEFRRARELLLSCSLLGALSEEECITCDEDEVGQDLPCDRIPHVTGSPMCTSHDSIPHMYMPSQHPLGQYMACLCCSDYECPKHIYDL